MSFILSVDQSTQGTKALLFDSTGRLLCRRDVAHEQIINHQGWVSHDPEEIYRNTVESIRRVIEASGVDSGEITALGISNQRETSVCWDKTTGKPIANAIVWQCGRAKELCQRIVDAGWSERVRQATGIPVSPFFPASKFAWLVENIPGAKEKAAKHQLCFKDCPQWLSMHQKITEKVVITACGEQDETYRTYLAEQWPGIQFVKTLQMGSYAYPWFSMPEGESKDTLRAAFMKREILGGKSALADGYCTWLDGKYYEGEGAPGQFGTNPEIAERWAAAGRAKPEPYDFISEGDSPTFFLMLDWGFRTLEDFSYGGIAGRYHRVPGEVNSKGEPLNLWDVSKDVYIDREGQPHLTESMWPYVADIQRDFAARVAWAAADSFEKGEHAPSLRIREGLDLTAKANQTISLHAEAASPDGAAVRTAFRVYSDASAAWAADMPLAVQADEAVFTIPEKAAPGDQLHIVVKAEAAGHHRLVHYQQVIVTIG